MIRTRDLVLFVLILAFLSLAILFTLAGQSAQPVNSVSFVETAPDDLSAAYETTELDRPSMLERLRQALAANETISAPEPVAAEPESVDAATATATAAVTQLVCDEERNALIYARTWPREGVAVQAAEGVRVVTHTVLPAVVPTGSSTPTPAPVVTPLMQLPLSPVLGDASCLASEIIGVTTAGTLLFNSDAIAYHRQSATTLIGYARDGVPVYGAYNGETDECGGYELDGTYRYSVSPDRTFILGCYRAAPQQFVGE